MTKGGYVASEFFGIDLFHVYRDGKFQTHALGKGVESLASCRQHGAVGGEANPPLFANGVGNAADQKFHVRIDERFAPGHGKMVENLAARCQIVNKSGEYLFVEDTPAFAL